MFHNAIFYNALFIGLLIKLVLHKGQICLTNFAHYNHVYRSIFRDSLDNTILSGFWSKSVLWCYSSFQNVINVVQKVHFKYSTFPKNCKIIYNSSIIGLSQQASNFSVIYLWILLIFINSWLIETIPHPDFVLSKISLLEYQMLTQIHQRCQYQHFFKQCYF